MDEPLTLVGEYELGKVLGSGSTGEVRLGRHRVTGELVAVKIINKKRLQDDLELHRKVRREIAVMKLIHHPNILKLYDVYESKHHLLLVLEYAAQGELFDRLVDRGYMNENEARNIFQQIIEAIDHCHQRDVCHRDLKSENILIAADGTIKLADFGFCSLVGSGSMLETKCGSLSYLAPEILSGDPYDGRRADIWSCGILLFALVTGGFPIDCDSIQRQLLVTRSWGKTIPFISLPSELSLECRELIQAMLTINPASRMSAKDVKNSRWYNLKPLTRVYEGKEFTLTERLPIKNPDMRIVRQLVDIGCGQIATILRRLRGKRQCVEREFYSFLQEHHDRISRSKPVQAKPPLTPQMDVASRPPPIDAKVPLNILPPSIAGDAPWQKLTVSYIPILQSPRRGSVC